MKECRGVPDWTGQGCNGVHMRPTRAQHAWRVSAPYGGSGRPWGRPLGAFLLRFGEVVGEGPLGSNFEEPKRQVEGPRSPRLAGDKGDRSGS